MKILVLHSRYGSGAMSGENRVVDDEVRLLQKGGHEVEVYTPRGADVGKLRAGVSAIWSTLAVEELRRRLLHFEPDVVHFHNLFPMFSPTAIREAARAAPVVLTLHNFRLMCLPATFLRDGRICKLCQGRVPIPGVRHRCYRNSLPGSASLATALTFHRAIGSFDRVSRFFAVSEFIRVEHIASGLPPGRIVVKPNFVWESPTRRSGPGEYFLYAGRLSSEKGIVEVAQAWDPSHGKLVVLGDGPERARLTNLAASGVEVQGSVSPATVFARLAHARAVIAPSLSFEGAPRIILEAFAAGVPVVASRVGSLPELVEHGRNGLLFAPGDMDELAGALEELRDDTRTDSFGNGAFREWQECYSPPQALVTLEARYRDAITAGTTD